MKKVLAIVLCAAMIFKFLPAMSTRATENLEQLAVSQNGNVVEAVVLPQNEKVELTAATSTSEELAYQWQILAYGDLWVNIEGKTDASIDLSYALVANLLTDGVAKVRCKALSDAGELCSQEVSVTVEYAASVSQTGNLLDNENVDQEEKVDESNAEVSENESEVSGNDAEETATQQYATFNVQRVATRVAYGVVPANETVETPATYSIVINYVFGDGEQAANSWTAKVAAGSNFTQTVTSPTVLGYTPDQASVALNYSNIDGDKTVTVTYAAAQVDYTVVHYQQNLNDDNYTEVECENKDGYTEDSVGGGLEKSYEGFYSLLYDTTTAIAADGSTVVEIYYDRYYYLMTFDLDGGYGVEPIYARFGAPISVGVPAKAGFDFVGWDPELTYTTMPAQNTTYQAKWTGTPVTFDVVYWYENAEDEHFSQAGVQYDVSATAGQVINGETYKDYAFEGRDDKHFTYYFADENVVINGDGSTVVNVYFHRNTYTLTFEAEGLCVLEEHAHTDSCYGLNCIVPEHTHGDNCKLICSHQQHDLSCYGLDAHDEVSKPSQITETNLVSGEVYTYYTTEGSIFGSYQQPHYYLYLNGKWYCHHGTFGGNRDYNEIEVSSCSHTVHSSICYSCGKIEHTHSAVGGNCYGLICDLTQHTHTNNCESSSATNVVKVITAKYGEDIQSYWPIKNDSGFDGTGYWWDDEEDTVFSNYTVSLDSMPGASITFTGEYYGDDAKIYYYLENLTGDTSGREYERKYYTLEKTVITIDYGNLTRDEEFHDIPGFTQGSYYPSNIFNNVQPENYLYYTRNSYTLSFSNYGTTVAGKGGSVQYEAPLSSFDFTPDYPSTLEPNAYVFEGWYESPFYGDTKVDFSTAKMPASDLTLYARWVPINHNVNIYLTVNENGTLGNKVGDTQVVVHRATATDPYPDAVPVHPASDKYKFVGWFYMDGDTEKAFDFSMPVTYDLDLYAKWSSNVLMEYTIKYAVENEDGTLTYIAEETTGSGLAGTTKTFEAKAGDELKEGYQSGYFPETNSHSLTIDIDPTKNKFTFIYVPKDEVPYTVKYLEFETGNVLRIEKNELTRDAVITETFEPIIGYMPDAYQKRLVLSADETQNVIIFWYVKDDTHAPVQIIHYIQNAEGDGYTEYQSSTDLNGIINNTYSTDVLTISGYTFDHATANDVAVTEESGKVTGKVTAEGLILELYYNRNLYPYEFRFLEQGTNAVLADPVTGMDRYGSQVTQNSKNIPGYTCSDDALAMTIQIEDGSTASKNVRIFYYTEQEVTINYVVVGPAGAGTVSPATEILKVFSGNASGSTPTANDGYRFVGWYIDEDCKTPVEESWVSDGHITPQKTKDYDSSDVEKLGYEAATYYALFELGISDLTIQKMLQEPVKENQNFIFEVNGIKGTNTEGFSLTVVVNIPEGNYISKTVTLADLPIGSYTVTEQNNWRYQTTDSGYKEKVDSTQDITLVADSTQNIVTFYNKRVNDQWLSESVNKNNQFVGVYKGTN